MEFKVLGFGEQDYLVCNNAMGAACFEQACVVGVSVWIKKLTDLFVLLCQNRSFNAASKSFGKKSPQNRREAGQSGRCGSPHRLRDKPPLLLNIQIKRTSRKHLHSGCRL